MSISARRHRAALLALLLASLPGACATAPKTGATPNVATPPLKHEPVAEERWTTRFASERVLTASEVTIEGPRGLLAHVFVTQDNYHQTQEVKATPQGLRVETRTNEGGDYTPVRAQLDQWTITADRRLVVLENPNATAVVITARGDVFLSADANVGETRSNELRVVGELRK